MTGRLRYLRLTAARTRAPLLPLAACVFWVVGIYSYEHNEVGQTFGLTALLCCALDAWLVAAILAGEPAAQADMASAALGGDVRRARRHARRRRGAVVAQLRRARRRDTGRRRVVDATTAVAAGPATASP
ncbi:MAG TPA: hypothetical protein VHZ31_05740 [Solirubrobacteraceae bacterium]|jgi:hypothetical protein|nr:hypothetical protein [Solirubrobacteraceae bacterium]